MKNANWCAVRDALESAIPELRKLAPSIMSTIHVGPSNGEPERFHVTLFAESRRDLTADEKVRLVAKAKPIIEQRLQSQGYSTSAIPTFTYGVMFENSGRNMETVGRALANVQADLSRLSPPVISTYCLGPFSGDPEDFSIYLGVETHGELSDVKQNHLIGQARPLLERSLRRLGYSVAALSSFQYLVVAQKEIDEAGGWYPFLR